MFPQYVRAHGHDFLVNGRGIGLRLRYDERRDGRGVANVDDSVVAPLPVSVDDELELNFFAGGQRDFRDPVVELQGAVDVPVS